MVDGFVDDFRYEVPLGGGWKTKVLWIPAMRMYHACKGNTTGTEAWTQCPGCGAIPSREVHLRALWHAERMLMWQSSTSKKP